MAIKNLSRAEATAPVPEKYWLLTPHFLSYKKAPGILHSHASYSGFHLEGWRAISTIPLRHMTTLLGKTLLLATLAAFASPAGAKAGNQPAPAVTKDIFKVAEKNENWKTAFQTGTQMQVVFMNVSPATNPKNEIGMEKHPFDQAILIVEGKGEAVLDGKRLPFSEGDMIFIPKGTEHDVINTDKDGELKVASFYSQMDIPAGSVYKTKADEPAAD